MYFSARSASPEPLLFQQITRCHSVFSCFSPFWPVHCRLVARDRLATRDPLLVLRTSGSAPKLPISMTLFRLLLTAASGRWAGGGQGCPRLYDPQVILSIKDTPLVPFLRRRLDCRNGGPEDHRVLHRPTVVSSSTTDVLEAERPVQLLSREVRFAHLQEYLAHPGGGERREELAHQTGPDSAAAGIQRHAEVQDLALVAHRAADDIAQYPAVPFGDEDLHAHGEAIFEVASGPGIREGDPLDRDECRQVSCLSRTDVTAGVRDAPPSEPAPPQDGRSRARPQRRRPGCGPHRTAGAGRGATQPQVGASGRKAAPARSTAPWRRRT